MTDPKSLTDEEIKAISRMDCTFSVHTVRRLLAAIAARDAEIERLRGLLRDIWKEHWYEDAVNHPDDYCDEVGGIAVRVKAELEGK